MLLSGVWFSLEGAEPWVRQVAAVFPLTYVLEAARAVMLDGSGLGAILPDLLILVAMSAVFTVAGGRYRRQPDARQF